MLYRLARALLFVFPAETAHHLGSFVLRLIQSLPGMRGIVSALFAHRDPVLETKALGLTFPSPLGMAAGFDKDAKVYDALGALGFGFVEVGTLTPKAQPGNPKPRMFRLAQDRALINRLGFNNGGAEGAIPRLQSPRHVVVGVNIGKNKVTPEAEAVNDYVACAEKLTGLADYLVRKTVWLIGGDGWAYDIGYGGLDHVLSLPFDVRILVLDTEVYSNTGGQASKSTPIGASAKFAASGKGTQKKDLGLMAMSYRNAYVASVAFGANDNHTVKALQDYTRLKAQALADTGDGGGQDIGWLLVLEQLIFQAEAEARWLDHCEARLVRHAATAAATRPGRRSDQPLPRPHQAPSET